MKDHIFFLANVDAGGIIKAPIAAYKKQNNLSEEVDYNLGVTAKMLTNSSYSGITAKIDAAVVVIKSCNDAIIAASNGTGTAKQKNMAAYLMGNQMKILLTEIQIVGNADPSNAAINYEKVNCTFRTRAVHERDDLEVYHGEISGTFDLYINPPEGVYSVIWYYTLNPDDTRSWDLADFNYNSKGFLEGCAPGQYYYFKAKFKSSITGISDWTQIVKIMCL